MPVSMQRFFEGEPVDYSRRSFLGSQEPGSQQTLMRSSLKNPLTH